jgi:hypothetical protein
MLHSHLTIAMISMLAAGPDVQEIIERSVVANNSDWQAAPEYDYTEQDLTGETRKTYEVRMLLGSPYRQLVEVDGQPLPAASRESEQREMANAVAHRRAESTSDRARRIAGYEKDRKRDQLLMDQITKAFDFEFVAERQELSRDVYVLRAVPRKNYHPPAMEARVLTGMRGELWIDKSTFQWVKVTATVIHPVSIEGVLARVEPGTYFELEKMPVADGIWLPKHFRMKSRSRILSIFNHRTQADETYSDYHKSAPKQ